jgi:hypothetical protein
MEEVKGELGGNETGVGGRIEPIGGKTPVNGFPSGLPQEKLPGPEMRRK